MLKCIIVNYNHERYKFYNFYTKLKNTKKGQTKCKIKQTLDNNTFNVLYNSLLFTVNCHGLWLVMTILVVNYNFTERTHVSHLMLMYVLWVTHKHVPDQSLIGLRILGCKIKRFLNFLNINFDLIRSIQEPKSQ